MCKSEMPKGRYNFTLTKKTLYKLETLAKRHSRSKSNMIEVLIKDAYDNKTDVRHAIIKDTLENE